MSSVADPDPSHKKSQAEQLYQKACSLTNGELILHETQYRKAPSFWTKLKLKRAARLFEKVLHLYPNHWNSMWILGKTLQRLGDERTAFDWFAKAAALEPNNADVPREASLSAMHLGLSRHAIEYCEEALKIEPGEPGLMCNLALALLYDAKPEQALDQARRAVESDPRDKVSNNVLRAIEHIIKTKGPCPRNSNEMQKYCQTHRDIFR